MVPLDFRLSNLGRGLFVAACNSAPCILDDDEEDVVVVMAGEAEDTLSDVILGLTAKSSTKQCWMMERKEGLTFVGCVGVL